MDIGEQIFSRIFGIRDFKSHEEVKTKIRNNIKRLMVFDVKVKHFKRILARLSENEHNDKVNEYVRSLTEGMDQDKKYQYKTVGDLIAMLNPCLQYVTKKAERLANLNPLILFLSEECNDKINDKIKSLIKKIKDLQDEDSKVSIILQHKDNDDDDDIVKLLTIPTISTLPSNIFYRFVIKKLFEDDQITSPDDLFNHIVSIKEKCKNDINIDNIKTLSVHEFENEIIKKTQALMINKKSKYASSEINVSNLVYKWIESDYQDFEDLSSEDKTFLRFSVIHIMHFNDFSNLGSFFKQYFKAQNDKECDFELIKYILEPIKEDDPLINDFQNFDEFCQSHKKNELFNQDLKDFSANAKFPEILNSGIKIEHVSEFFAFWTSISRLVSLFMNDASNESVFVPQISNYLKDKNLYAQFQKKMQQAYIEPTLQNIYVIFESLMKMLNASEIANSGSFNRVSKNAEAFFDGNLPEFYKIIGGLEDLLKNEKKIVDLFATDKANAVIKEYEYVKKILEGQCFWEISYKNHIRLISKDEKHEIVASFAKLRLYAAKLNIVMIKTENISKLDEYKNSQMFVKFFQTSESLYEKLSILHQMNFAFGNKVFQYDSLDYSEIEKLIENFKTIIDVINQEFEKVYEGSICLFTKEQFFNLYHLFNQFFQKKEQSQDFVSIFEGTIISTFVESSSNPLKYYYNTIKNEKLEPFEFDENINDEEKLEEAKQKLKVNFVDFSKILKKLINELLRNRKNADEYSVKLEIPGNLEEYLAGGTVRCINCNFVSIPAIGNFTSKYQLHSMILYLLKTYRSKDVMPFPVQILICSMSTTLSQIDSFFNYFEAMTNTYEDEKEKKRPKCMFIVVSPIQLQPNLFDYMVTKLKKINETTISQSRIVVLFEDDDLKKKKALEDIIKSINVDCFKPVTKTEPLKNFYCIKNENETYGIQAYYIYDRFPRTGKTHRILEHIHEKYPDHIYARILVDESTTLPTLINRLNEVGKIGNKGKPIIIHFNVDGKCNSNFHLYIQNLAFFRSLNDGVSIPFLVNNKMVFYFEFGSRPAFDKNDFIQNVFPIAEYIEEIKFPKKKEEFFTFDEYLTVPHEEVKGALFVTKNIKYRKHLIETAVIARLDQDVDTFLTTEKSALYVKYIDYIDYYNRFYKELEDDPARAYKYLVKMFKDINDVPKEFKEPLISQISDVSKVISKFKGPILSSTVYETEKGVGYNIRRFLVGLIIEAAITNCGLPYMPPLDGDKIIESTEKDSERLKQIKKFITRGHMLAVCNPAGNSENQSFTLINNEDKDFDELLKKFNYGDKDQKKFEDIKNAIKSALKVIDSEWRKNQECPDELFKLFANILNLEENEKDKYNIALMVNTWRSLKDDGRDALKTEWDENIEELKTRVRNDNRRHLEEIHQIYKESNPDPDFSRRKDFWEQIQIQIHNKSLFDINIVEEGKESAQNMINVSNDIYTFISNCEKYIQNKNSLMLKYTLTPQNIMRFIHLVYRIYSNVPIVLMGETGSGKTFTLHFLAEIIGKNVELIKRVIDGGTKEEDLRAFLRATIKSLTIKRSNKLKEKLRSIANDKGIPDIIAKTIHSLPISENEEDKDVIITDFDDIKDKIEEYIDNLDKATLSKNYEVYTDEEKEGFKKYVVFNIMKICQNIEDEQKSYLFFFDEVNTAPCQWFIKEVILDRYFEGEILPKYIHFVCAVNPSRQLKNTFGESALDALDPIYNNDSQDERRNLVYKVVQMPESFVPYLFPADPNREYGSYSDSNNEEKSEEDYLFDMEINSEFDVSIDKKVESEFSLKTYPFITVKSDNNNGEYKKVGDDHHFSFTDMFSTSFDFPFFLSILKDPKKALSYSRAISRLISRINIFCCRFSYHEIYKDESFSSIRDPERCIQIMRWAYKFGIFEKYSPKMNSHLALSRLRRAFIIGLSVSFWIRLSDQKAKDGGESHRAMFIRKVRKYWKKLLNDWDAVKDIKDVFKAPENKEWENIIKEECKNYADLFVDDDECVSKNSALSENIWVSFICIMNNITLWIIGKPGTSKSLALNIVTNKLMNQNSTSEKITKCPPLVTQTFMCSNTTTTEAIMDQLGKIVERANMYDDNYIIRIQVLEEIGHADMSRFKPLVCLHNIIDNGYPVAPDVSVPVQLIGLSNYKMDSAKLNRGILLLRCSLGAPEIKTTASGIFESTNLAWSPDSQPSEDSLQEIKKYKNKIEAIGENYQKLYESSHKNTEKPFIGLRDFYGLIQSITKPICSGSISQKDILQIVRRNFSGIPPSIENLSNEKTKEIIIEVMKALFGREFIENNFNKLLLQLKNSDGNGEEEEEDRNEDKNEDKTEKKTEKENIENVTCYYNMTQLIQNNISQEHHLLKTPIFRHILISTMNAAAVFILVQNEILQFTNYSKDSPYELFFANNMSNLPDAEWISNELRRLTEIMYDGEKTAIFIGKHPCFDSLYDIFNLRYQKEGGSNDNDNNNDQKFVAMIAYGGDSYPTLVSGNFKAIIILESNVYKELPQPFLNRFEKFNLTYESELLPSVRSEIRDTLKKCKKNLQKDLSSVFGCYSDELLLSIYHIVVNSKGNLALDDLLFLSIHPADLIYSTKNDISYPSEKIEYALKENARIRSSLPHLLYGYKGSNKGDYSISGYLYKMWQKNSGIKAVVMVPSFHNIEKIEGYDFILIDSSNSVNIDARIKSHIVEIENKSQESKSYKPIVISILISTSECSIDLILQYEYILETIHRWSYNNDDIKIKKRPIHTLIMISMEHKNDNLKINQSTEWPLIYLDTCYDDTIKTVNNNGLPLDLEQLVFTSLKELVNDEIIDIEELIKLARQSIHPCYTKLENELIDSILFDKKENYQTYIFDPITSLIKTEKDESTTAIEIFNSDFEDLWSLKKITLLPSPPSSLIQYLSLKLVNAIGDVMGIIFEILLSGLDPVNATVIEMNVFENTDLFFFMMDRPELSDSFFWLFNGDSTRAYPIDYRYSFDVENPGIIAFYKFVWQVAMKICSCENVKEPKDLLEKMNEELFTNNERDSVKTLFDDLMDSELSSSELKPSFAFIASYLLVIADMVRVDSNHKQTFVTWISCYIEILKGLFGKIKKVTMDFLMYHLVNNKELIGFSRDFTITYMFFPIPIKDDKITESQFRNKEKELFSKLVSRKVIKDLTDLPESCHINTEAAYLLNLISNNFAQTIRNLDISIVEANDLFRNEFATLLSTHNSLIYCSDYIDDYSYQNEPKYFPFLMMIQKFFIEYGEVLMDKPMDNEKISFAIKYLGSNKQSIDYSNENTVIKYIPEFVRENIKKLKLSDVLDEGRVVSTLMMYYLESIYNVYVGMIDADIDTFDSENFIEEEEEEEAEDDNNDNNDDENEEEEEEEEEKKEINRKKKGRK